MVKTVNLRVRIIGRQIVDWDSMEDFLSTEGILWKSQTLVGAESLSEIAGRLSYMSFARPRPGGSEAFFKHIISVGHGSVLEAAVWNFLLTGISRSLSHELIRYRTMSPNQLSQRYIDGAKAEYVVPPDLAEEVECALYSRENLTEDLAKRYPRAHFLFHTDPQLYHKACQAGRLWLDSVQLSHDTCEKLTHYLTDKAKKSREDLSGTDARKYARQAARSVLPNAAETKIVITANARSIRNFIEQRASRHADTEIRGLAVEMWRQLVAEAPNLFGDYTEEVLPDGTSELTTPYRKV